MCNKKILKATISDLVVVFLNLLILINVMYYFGQDKINYFFDTVQLVLIKPEPIEVEEIKMEITDEKTLTRYPYYGEEYGNVKIESIGVDLPLFYGDSLEILKNGIGQDQMSYFPGEGGSILCMGHNYEGMLRNFSELNLGDIIKVTTEYGEYNYRIYDMKILDETDVDAAPIQEEKEIFMIYTCYPFNNIGYAYQRYMVYAELVQDVGGDE